MTTPPRADGPAGFTLVELLVSMVVLALVALTMMAGLRFTIRAFADTDSRRAALEELTLGFSVLRAQIERAEPLMLKVNGESRVLFDGTPDRIRLVNIEPPYLAGRPYLALEFTIAGGPGEYRIELRRLALDPAKPDLGEVAAAEPRVLLRVPQLLQFTYWGQARRDDRPQWFHDWTRRTQLPVAVRLAAGDDPGWPDLIVPITVRTPWYCAAGQNGAAGAQGGGSGQSDAGGLRSSDSVGSSGSSTGSGLSGGSSLGGSSSGSGGLSGSTGSSGLSGGTGSSGLSGGSGLGSGSSTGGLGDGSGSGGLGSGSGFSSGRSGTGNRGGRDQAGCGPPA